MVVFFGRPAHAAVASSARNGMKNVFMVAQKRRYSQRAADESNVIRVRIRTALPGGVLKTFLYSLIVRTGNLLFRRSDHCHLSFSSLELLIGDSETELKMGEEMIG